MNIENQKFEDWRNEQIASLVRMGYLDAAKAFRDLGSVQWAGWQAGWQASRAAIEVELPKIAGFEGAYDSLRDHEFCATMSDVEDADEIFGLCRSVEVREAIESLGLKVKP